MLCRLLGYLIFDVAAFPVDDRGMTTKTKTTAKTQPADDQVADELQELFESLGSDGAHKCELYRHDPASQRLGYVGDIDPAWDKRAIASKFGGGRYRCRVRGSGGTYTGGVSFDIEGAPRIVRWDDDQVDDQRTANGTPSGQPSSSLLETLLVSMMQAQSQMLTAMMTRDQPQSDLAGVAALIDAVKPKAQQPQSISELIDAVKSVRELAGDAGGGGGDSSGVWAAALTQIGKLAEKQLDSASATEREQLRRELAVARRQLGAQTNPPTAAQPATAMPVDPPPASPASPIDFESSDDALDQVDQELAEQQALQAHPLGQLATLLRIGAKSGGTPAVYAEVIADSLDAHEDGMAAALVESTSAGELTDKVIELAPDLEREREFVQDVERELRTSFDGDDGPAGKIEPEPAGASA